MTEENTKIREAPIKKVFFSYLIPAVLGMVFMSINIVLDGIFIGHSVGPNGLAAVNIAVPIFSIFISISLWIGVGGAALYSISLGKGQKEKALQYFSQSVLIVLAVTFLITVLSIWKVESLAIFLGANDVIMPYVLDYMGVLVTFGFVFVIQNILSIFVRNDGNPQLAMASTITNALFNIVLNYIFLFPLGLGVKGAAYATIISATIGMIVILFHFIMKKGMLRFQLPTFSKRDFKEILSIGFPSFISEMAIAFVTVVFNIAFMKTIGEIGVAAFSIVNYLHSLMLLTFIGVSSAIQPIISYHYGAKLFARMKESLRLGEKTALILGIFFLTVGLLLPKPLTMIFGVESGKLFEITIQGIRLFFISYLFMGFNMVIATFYQSIGQTKLSLFITLSRGMVLVAIFTIILTPLFGTVGIWLAMPAAEALTSIVILFTVRSSIEEYQLD